ncbi:hypothetical protein TSUD_363480 [Trifolium subterraneum]|uniref:Uncharacterized protein n=1 Tax=Trifolium subterraneum TaxID=3900 RepID=A0A2Z6NT04_TRISU|nr:hypothetical protein TSUD_363480 [Trifolium subterraneum]
MRGLWEKIDKFIGLQPGELDKAQRQLVHLYKDQKCTILDTKNAVFGEIDHPLGVIDYRLPTKVYRDGRFIMNNVHHYLKTGGHYMICTKADNMNSKGHIIFSSGDINREFKLLRTVPLDLVEGAYFIDIGGYRMQPE